ncbi:LysE family transporter [Pelagibius sp. CAU 1746]|uniref:LysE family translocator n=1 Tax=Pelagibius sp. CAU 1746 TaxID=3140370 RepID=UPI00325BFCC9
MLAVNPDLFAAYLFATVVLILMPGPIVTLVIANSLAYGQRTGLATVAGSTSGNALLVAAGALGLTTLLALAADVFEVLRWAGVAYLIYLGLKQWRAALRAEAAPGMPATRSARRAFGQAVLVAITNPKTIFFYAAFFPQFIDPALAAGPQLLAMSLAFVAITVLLDGAYALLASRVRGLFASARANRVRHGITGTLLLGTGLGLALARR